MRIKLFNELLGKVFNTVALDANRLQMNGSFLNSYWASDIDLYEKVSSGDMEKLIKGKVDAIRKSYILLEVKTVRAGHVRKYRRSQLLPRIHPKTDMVKVDFVLMFLAFPIECSIIYDRAVQVKRSSAEIERQLLEDAKNPKYNMYKRIKRLASAGAVLGHKNLFRDITEDARLGVLYLSNERLKTLRSVRSIVGDATYAKYAAWIQEDLRKYGHSPKDDLDGAINKLILRRLS